MIRRLQESVDLAQENLPTRCVLLLLGCGVEGVRDG